jgi:hypothetical protein
VVEENSRGLSDAAANVER